MGGASEAAAPSPIAVSPVPASAPPLPPPADTAPASPEPVTAPPARQIFERAATQAFDLSPGCDAAWSDAGKPPSCPGTLDGKPLPAAHLGSHGTEEPPAKRPRTSDEESQKTEDLFEFAMCVVCQEVMHRATSAQPCNHSFCSACLGVWLRRRPRGGSVCPVCRNAVVAVSRQHQMDGLIQGLLKAHPSKRRSDHEINELDSNDPLQAAGYDLAKLLASAAPAAPAGAAAPVAFGALLGAGGGGGLFSGTGVAGPFGAFGVAPPPAAADSDDEDSNSDSEASDSASAPPVPAGPPCFRCGAGSWRTLTAAADSLGAGSFGGARACTDFVRQSLMGNDFERGVLEEWLAVRGRGLGAALQDALATPNPAGVAPVRMSVTGSAPGAPAGMPDGAWTDLRACRGCGMGVLRALVYALRERIPDGELPARAQGRGKCWYGRNCRTQAHKPAHASKLNHICEQTRG